MAEKAMTVDWIAKEYGYSKGFVRSACHRDEAHHRRPHIKTGTSRRVMKIRPSQFEKWRDEEELLS